MGHPPQQPPVVEGGRSPSVAPTAHGTSALSPKAKASAARRAKHQASKSSKASAGPARSGLLKWRRRFRVTREGKYFIGITFGVGFAAINTANNLLYLLLGMLLALIGVSSVMSELSLRRLTVVRRLPPRAQVGRPHLVEVEVHNHKGKVPSYAIEIEDLRLGQPADKRCFFLKISPDSAQVAAYRRTPARRGRDVHTGFRIATRFPFGLFEKSRETTEQGDIVIYPEVIALRLPQNPRGISSGTDGYIGAGFGDDVLGVRPMREGDDYRDIYWRKSAGARQLVLRERARETSREVKLTIDSVLPGKALVDAGLADTGVADAGLADALPNEVWHERFEDRIREVASLAVAHIKRGDRVLVVTTSGESVAINTSVGADPLLRFLALLQPTSAAKSSAGASLDTGAKS